MKLTDGQKHCKQLVRRNIRTVIPSGSLANPAEVNATPDRKLFGDRELVIHNQILALIILSKSHTSPHVIQFKMAITKLLF